MSLRSGWVHPIPTWTPRTFRTGRVALADTAVAGHRGKEGGAPASRPPDPAQSLTKRVMKVKYLAQK